jgi:hypothetical protein
MYYTSLAVSAESNCREKFKYFKVSNVFAIRAISE